MPYIKQEDRKKFEDLSKEITTEDPDTVENIFRLLGERITTAGELNYVISNLCLEYLRTNGKNYQKMNDIMGALTGVQFELYRRVIAPYEEEKIKSNGDIL